MLRLDERGERIPLTLADWDASEGSVSVAVMSVGTTTRRLAELGTGDAVLDCVGPLGLPTQIRRMNHVVCVAGGFAVATIYPIAREMKRLGNRVTCILGARHKDLLFWQDRLQTVCDDLIVTTDDGSAGRQGVVTEPLKELCEATKPPDQVIAIGPSIMMKFSALTTKPYGVPTVVSLNPIMVDGTGMCGCCRVMVGSVTRFVCVDGPDFDGHQVDWNLLLARQKIYLAEEKDSLERYQCSCVEK